MNYDLLITDAVVLKQAEGRGPLEGFSKLLKELQDDFNYFKISSTKHIKV